MKIGGFENRANAKRRRLQLVVGTSENGRVAARGFGEAQQHSQRRRLASSVGPEETGDRPRLNSERQIVDCEHVTVSLGERITLNYVRHLLAFAFGNFASLIRHIDQQNPVEDPSSFSEEIRMR